MTTTERARHLDRTSCPARKHGTRAAYKAGCRCADGLHADRMYRKRSELGIQPTGYVPTFGSQRRIQALQAIGYSRKHLAEHLGYAAPSHSSLSPVFWRTRIHRDLATRITALYDHLSMTPGPSNSARIRARKQGYAPPLAWDDTALDDPTATPDTGTAEATEPDPIAVELAVNGKRISVQLRPVERDAAIREMARRGMGPTSITKQLGCSTTTVRNALKEVAA